jgi:hypothetical protein
MSLVNALPMVQPVAIMCPALATRQGRLVLSSPRLQLNGSGLALRHALDEARRQVRLPADREYLQPHGTKVCGAYTRSRSTA